MIKSQSCHSFQEMYITKEEFLMNLYDIILIGVSLISIPLVCVIWLDAFYAHRKRVEFSLLRTAGWYAAIFVVSFVPTVIAVYNLKG